MSDAQDSLNELLSEIEVASRAAGRFKSVSAELADVLGLDPAEVYVSFVSGGSKNAKQRVDQTKPHHRVVLLLLDDEDHLEGAENMVRGFVSDGALDAIALAGFDGTTYPIQEILAAPGSPVAKAFSDAFSDAKVVLVSTEEQSEEPESDLDLREALLAVLVEAGATALPTSKVVAAVQEDLDAEAAEILSCLNRRPEFIEDADSTWTADPRVVAADAVRFSASDVELFVASKGKKWAELTKEEIALGSDMRSRFKALTEGLAVCMQDELEWSPYPSQYNVNGRPATDLWGCVVPVQAPTQAYGLELALIVHEEGAEYLFCVGSRTGGGTKIDLQAARDELDSRLDRLRTFPSASRGEVDGAISALGYDYRKQWRSPGANDYDDLSGWLDAGPGPGAAISIDVEPGDLADEAPLSELRHFGEALLPLYEWAYEPPSADGDEPAPIEDLDPHAIESKAKEAEPGFELPLDVYARMAAAVMSGKHVMLTGPPGTGKTTVAEALCRAARDAGWAQDEHVLTTATSDWTTYETIGGLRPTPDGLRFRPGQLLAAIGEERWLLVDELNRASFDQAFGQLFTVLSGQAVVLPYEDPENGKPVSVVPEKRAVPPGTSPVKVPGSWRLIATMNVFDKDLLFEMSYALMRRFAFVEIPVPSDAVYEKLIALEAEGDTEAEDVAGGLMAVRAVKEIGPATFRDVARYIRVRRGFGPVSASKVALEAFHGFLLPQFEGSSETDAEELLSVMKPLLDSTEGAELTRLLSEVLGFQHLAAWTDSSGAGHSAAGA